MTRLFTMIGKTLAITLTLAIGSGCMSGAKAETDVPSINLAVSFEPDKALLTGTCRLDIPANLAVKLLVPDLEITAAVLSRPGLENSPFTVDREIMSIPVSKDRQNLLLSYRKKVEDSFSNSIGRKAIVLTSSWHPFLDRKAVYHLEAAVPPGFKAVSQADAFNETSPEGEVSFSFSQPIRALTFAAAPYVRMQKTVRPGLDVFSLFFPEDSELAEGYLESAAVYIKRYEELIGPFPYSHYVIVENLKPTGFGLPTFTLLGRQVVRLPFIRQTSLGHEILHSWFGNSIDIQSDSGNWCEGLTTYLADMAYRTDKGEGAAARKETIQNYLSYVTADIPPLAEFVSVGHDRLTNRAERAVGYGKAAMLFHELQVRIGSSAFEQGLRRFYREFKDQTASWQDIEEIFAEETDADLTIFFDQRLNSNTLPDLSIEKIAVDQKPDMTILSFDILQNQDEPLDLLIPIAVETVSGISRYHEHVTEAETTIRITLDSTPLQLSLDPGYDLMRNLSPDERAPIWSDIMGAKDTLVLLADNREKNVYAPFLELADHFSWPVSETEGFKQEDLRDRAVIILGTDSELSKTLFGKPAFPETGFTLEVRQNPLGHGEITLVSAANREETEAVVSRLPHYGKYSYLHFEQGRITEETIAPADDGIIMQLEEKPAGFALTAMSEFNRLADELSQYRVIYLGETHTSRADHLLQSMLIEALYHRDKNYVIGMEMFPRSSQPALDRYINDHEFSEASFLRQSRYYEVWRYDYRLFRPIFAFARKNRIPVIGLNLERDVVSSVFKAGGTSNLEPEVREKLPAERNLALPGYVKRLSETYEMHSQDIETAGTLSGFIQAQALWDETMAESITNYLNANPDSRMIVLAGAQHTRKDSGIPPRVASRLDIPQTSVANLATSRLSQQELSATVDYLFMLETSDFPPQGKIGIILEERKKGNGTEMVITGVSPHTNASQADIHKNDLLLSIDGQKTETMDDVRIAMLTRSVGEKLPLVVGRPDSDGTLREYRLQVVLSGPPSAGIHP